MEIRKEIDGEKLSIRLSGRLDTGTASQLDQELKKYYETVTEIQLDFTKLEYLSSAGIRVLVSAQKKLATKNGKIEILHANETIREIFDVTGMTAVFTLID